MKDTRDFNNLSTWLPPKIEASKLSVEMFARKVKISRAQLYRYFTDVSRPTTQTMARICRVVGVPLEQGLKQYSERKQGRPFGDGGTKSVTARTR